MGAIQIIFIVGGIIFVVATCYACCVVAGRSDELDQKMYEDWLAANNKDEEK